MLRARTSATSFAVRRTAMTPMFYSAAAAASAALPVCSRRFASSDAAAAAAAAAVADISPMTEREKRKAQADLLDRRVERFCDDMYALPVFTPVVLLLTVIGLGGFLLTWGFFVAKPVVDAHLGKAGDDEGSGADDLD